MLAEPLTENRLRAAFASREPGTADGSGCPDPEAIWRALRLELPRERVRELGAHATVCARCAEAWRLARDLMQHAPADVRAHRAPTHERWGRPGWRVGGALVAAAALAGFLLLLPRGGPALAPIDAPPTLRGVEDAIRPAIDLSVPLDRGACTLRWTGPADSRWEVRVATLELRVLAEAYDLEVTEFTVPAEALAPLPPGSKLVWQVHAILPDGRRVASRSFVQALE